MEPQRERLGVLGSVILLHELGPDPPRGAELRDLLEKMVVAAEEEGQASAAVVDGDASGQHFLQVDLGVGEGEGDLLDGVAAGFPHVVAGDGDRMELGDVLERILHRVDREAQAGRGGEDVGAAGVNSFKMSCSVPRSFSRPCRGGGDGDVEGGRRDEVALMVARWTPGERDASKRSSMSWIVPMCRRGRPRRWPGRRRHQAHLRQQVEGGGEPRLPRDRSQRNRSLVCRAEASVLAHGQRRPRYMVFDAAGIRNSPDLPGSGAVKCPGVAANSMRLSS